MNIFLAAVVTFFYGIESGKAYQACYQPTGGAESCNVMTNASYQVTVADDTEFDFYVKIDGEESERVTYRTAKKKAAPPLLSVGN